MKTEQEKIKIGNTIATVLKVKHEKANGYVEPRFITAWGTKTPVGLYETVNRIIQEGGIGQ